MLVDNEYGSNDGSLQLCSPEHLDVNSAILLIYAVTPQQKAFRICFKKKFKDIATTQLKVKISPSASRCP